MKKILDYNVHSKTTFCCHHGVIKNDLLLLNRHNVFAQSKWYFFDIFLIIISVKIKMQKHLHFKGTLMQILKSPFMFAFM